MRTSVLSRSVIAIASLAIGSAALAATPATAATPNGITRDMVLAAASGIRADANSETSTSPTTQAALNALAARSCTIPEGEPVQAVGNPVETPDGVDGVAVTALVNLPDGPTGLDELDTCSFVALAPIGSGTTFAGEAAVDIGIISFGDGGEGGSFPVFEQRSDTYQLSGDVFASPAVQRDQSLIFSAVTATGLLKAPGSSRVLTTSKVPDKKSKAEKRYAKKKFDRRIAAAKKTYAKALKKAGSNAAKRAVARMEYQSRKAAVTARYKYQIANYKLVKIRSSKADARRFSVTANGFFFGV